MTARKTKLGYHFAILHRLIIALCKRQIMDLGIQASHIPFIASLLNLTEPVTQDELSTALVIDKAATARALDQLERSGFVHRKVNPDNRRQKLVTATPKARDIEETFLSILERSSQEMTKDFSQEELDRLLDLLNRMITNATAAIHA